jgi:raffinose/stachyose/melibiose transport system permease protein
VKSTGLREPKIIILGRQIILVAACLVTLIPIVFLYLNTFKSLSEFFASPYGLPSVWRFDNYAKAWTEANVASTLTNSVVATAGGVMLNLVLAVPASYALSRLKFRFRPVIYFAFVGGMVVPVQLLVLPLLLVMRDLHLIGSIVSLVVAYSVLSLPMAILFLTAFFSTIPVEIEDAAFIDGANILQVLRFVVLPLARPGIAAVAILAGVWMWNDFIVALILATRPSSHTLPVGIMSFFGVYSTEWTLAFASVAIAATPFIVAYLFLTRQFISGLTAGAVHG